MSVYVWLDARELEHAGACTDGLAELRKLAAQQGRRHKARLDWTTESAAQLWRQHPEYCAWLARGGLIPASVAGNNGTATAGDNGTATAGRNGSATAGHHGTATAGYNGTATAGEYGTATAGKYGTATAGDNGTATAGEYGTATAGKYGTATAGEYGTATAGKYGTATAGYNGTATAGKYGTATAGKYGTATAGDNGTATAGEYGTATAGFGGAILIRWCDDGVRSRWACGVVGEDGVEANVAYVVRDGKLVRRLWASDSARRAWRLRKSVCTHSAKTSRCRLTRAAPRR